jgi:hypothetical protein
MDPVYVDVDSAIKEATRTLNYGYTVIHGRDCECTNCTAYRDDNRCTQLCFGCFADCLKNPYGMMQTLTREAYSERQEEKERHAKKLTQRAKRSGGNFLRFWMPKIMEAYDNKQLLKRQESYD